MKSAHGPVPPGIYYRKKRRRRKIAAVVSCLLLLCVLLAVYFQHNVTKVLISVSEATMRAHTTVAINDAVYYTLSDGVRYEDLVTVERNDAGEVTALSADSLKINKIARDAASISQSNLKNLSLNGIPVPGCADGHRGAGRLRSADLPAHYSRIQRHLRIFLAI